MSSGEPTHSGGDQGESPPLVAMLTGDLLFASKVKAAAASAGVEFYMGGSLPSPTPANTKLVILDLSTRGGLTETITQTCDQSCPDATVIAYGPHVQVQKLKAAREAGIETVLTNGQLDAGIQSILNDMA